MTAPAIKYKNGQSEALAFADLDVFELYQFIDLLVAGRTPEIVMLGANRNQEWVKSLDFACYLELAKYFIRENFQKAVEIATSDPIAGLKVGPLLMQMGALLKTMPPSSVERLATSAVTLPAAEPSGSNSSTAQPLAAAAPPTPPAS